MANKVYKITKDIPYLGLKKGDKARLSKETAENHNLKEFTPKTKAPEVENGVTDAS